MQNIDKEDFKNVSKDNPNKIKEKIKEVEEKKDILSNQKWSYSKSMAKFGFIFWVLGISAFLFSLVLYNGSFNIIIDLPPLSFALLIIAGVVPFVITAIFTSKFSRKTDELEKLRTKLISKHNKTMLNDIKRKIEPQTT